MNEKTKALPWIDDFNEQRRRERLFESDRHSFFEGKQWSRIELHKIRRAMERATKMKP